MKKLFILVFIVLMVSCETSKKKDDKNVDVKTLKSLVEQKSEEVLWTKSTEDSVLSYNTKRNENFNIGVTVNSDGLTALSVNEKVFPKIQDFSSLDVSMIQKEDLEIINAFCTNLLGLEYEKALDQYYNENLWALVLLKYDIETAGFNKFTSYVLGEGYWHDDFCELPVRFYGEKKQSFDAKLVFSKEKKLVFEVSHS